MAVKSLHRRLDPDPLAAIANLAEIIDYAAVARASPTGGKIIRVSVVYVDEVGVGAAVRIVYIVDPEEEVGLEDIVPLVAEHVVVAAGLVQGVVAVVALDEISRVSCSGEDSHHQRYQRHHRRSLAHRVLLFLWERMSVTTLPPCMLCSGHLTSPMGCGTSPK